MRDLVNPRGGGLQHSVGARGGWKKLRCLAARQPSDVEIEVELRESLADQSAPPDWRYLLAITSQQGGKSKAVVKREEVYKAGKEILSRPEQSDVNDPERLTETFLEQVNSNSEFREVAHFFEKTLYLHLVPQLLKFSDLFVARNTGSDPSGQGFLDEIAAVPAKIQTSRLRRIESTDNLILLEEPELSLHRRIVEQIPKLIYDARRSRKKAGGQIFVTTHSPALLSDTRFSGTFLILKPGANGKPTTVQMPSQEDLMAMKAGLTAADILLPQTAEAIGDL